MKNEILLKRTGLVIITTIITMLAEIYFGFISHSMALLADGFHMGTHALSFFITFIVCLIVIKCKNNEEKLNATGGFISAVLLFFTSIGIFIESVSRFIHPLTISFSQAILVAVIGLIVNGICIVFMDDEHHHGYHHEHHERREHSENLNYKAAYLHILSDALTSVLAIIALFFAKYLNLVFLDPLMGLVGAFLIFKWSVDLLKKSSKILFD